MDGEGKWSDVEIVPKDETFEERMKREEKLDDGDFPSCWSDDPTDWM